VTRRTTTTNPPSDRRLPAADVPEVCAIPPPRLPDGLTPLPLVP
jgi:hypothetical protein